MKLTPVKIVALALCTLVLLMLMGLNVLRVFDSAFYSLCIKYRPTVKAPSDSVVIVGIDKKSIEQIGAWKWPRSTLAALLQGIEDAQPSAVVIDAIFPKSDDSTGNDTLAQVLSRMRRPVMAFQAETFSPQSSTPQSQATALKLVAHRFQIVKNSDKFLTHSIFSVDKILSSDSMFTAHAFRMGFANVATDKRTQKLMEIIHVLKIGDDYFPSLALAGVATYLDLKPSELVLDGTSRVMLGTRLLPLSSYAASTYLNYRGGPGSITTISAADILQGRVGAHTLRNKLVFVGITAPGSIDFLPSPVGERYPGVEAWATAASDILQNSWIRHGGGCIGLLNGVVVLLIFPGLFLLFAQRRRHLALIIAASLITVSLLLSVVLFGSCSYFWNPAGHLVAALVLLGWIAAHKPSPAQEHSTEFSIEQPDDDTSTQLAPPSEADFLNAVPDTVTAQVVAARLSATPVESAAPPLPIAAATPTGTIIEQSLQTLQQQSFAPPPPAQAAVVAENIVEKLRQLAEGTMIRTLGSGGMADVYLVWKTRFEVYRAIKVLKPDLPESTLKRFDTEIRIFAKLNHPNIVHCYGTGDWYGMPYVEMEYINGASLEELLSKTGAVDATTALAITLLVCKALGHAHQQSITIHGQTYKGLIHRDIKPANILLSRSGQIKLTDFGIARPSEVSLHTLNSGNIVGTLPYLAPEQLEGGSIDARADIYALGATLYELLTGHRAFAQSEVTALINAKSAGTIGSLQQTSTLAPQLRVLIDKAMHLNAENRFQTALEFSTAIQKVLLDLHKSGPLKGMQKFAQERFSHPAFAHNA
jgi:serine/threonine-protein kinase